MANNGYWLGWSALTLMAAIYLGAVLTTDTVGSRRIFMPGVTTAGHYQIELACGACHTPFQGATSERCVDCHGAALTAASDSHPQSVFTDPRNADRVTQLDARSCITCHVEHRPERTGAIGVTVPDDFCHTCHANIAEERPSHAGMAFTTCASAGCHNYHDNTALYEPFLADRAGQPDLHAEPSVPLRDLAMHLSRGRSEPAVQTGVAPDAPAGVRIDAAIRAEWEADAHGRAGVTCTGCHIESDTQPAGTWVDRPRVDACGTCHAREVTGFLGGRHGMRLALGLPPMTPALARQPMKDSASARELSCSSCHTAHGFDTREAASAACLRCHDDGHSRAWVGSPHHALWTREIEGAAPAGTGVSCATCHLPRERVSETGVDRVAVQHNQNRHLRPNEKMIRAVCLECHGLGFALAALADPRLIANNFQGRPEQRVGSIEMAVRRRNAPAD